jgi:hypothetical protein
MLQVARSATVGRPGHAECRAMRAHFDARHWVRLPAVLDPALLADVQARVAAAEFVERRHPGVHPPSIDLWMAPNVASALLELAFNDPAVFRVVEAVTGCSGITRFGGFVYRLAPQAGHQHHWHDDLVEGRLVAMSVNLGPGTYEGGILELRDRASERMLDRIANTAPGDALLFRIAPTLQHRATAVTSGVKTAFAGWYFDDQPYASRLRDLASTTPSTPSTPSTPRTLSTPRTSRTPSPPA